MTKSAYPIQCDVIVRRGLKVKDLCYFRIKWKYGSVTSRSTETSRWWKYVTQSLGVEKLENRGGKVVYGGTDDLVSLFRNFGCTLENVHSRIFVE